MDVPNQTGPMGQDLLEQLIQLTGLPREWAAEQLQTMLTTSALAPASGQWTLDQIRHVMLEYLEQMEGELSEPALPTAE